MSDKPSTPRQRPIKRRVRFVMPVDIVADSEALLAEAIRMYRLDPCHASYCGDFSWEQKRPYVLKEPK